MKGASQRGNDILCDSRGFTYCLRNKSAIGTTIWGCKHGKRGHPCCKAAIFQQGNYVYARIKPQ